MGIVSKLCEKPRAYSIHQGVIVRVHSYYHAMWPHLIRCYNLMGKSAICFLGGSRPASSPPHRCTPIVNQGLHLPKKRPPREGLRLSPRGSWGAQRVSTPGLGSGNYLRVLCRVNIFLLSCRCCQKQSASGVATSMDFDGESILSAECGFGGIN